MNITDNTPAVFDPAARFSGIYTFLNDQGRSVWGGETFEELKANGTVGPDAVVLPFSEALVLEQQRQRRQYCRGPVQVTAEQWDDALNCLPPQRWVRGGSYESFRMSELLSGTIASFYVRVGRSLWTLNEEMDTSHDELVSQVIKAAAAAAVEVEA